MLVDTHCHLQFQGFNQDREEVIKRCREKGAILNLVGTQKDTSKAAVELAEKYDNMYASIATHPVHLHPTHVDEEESHFITREEDFDEEYYAKLVQSPKVIAIGECGLDLWHAPKDKSLEEVLEKQKKVFLKHAAFAQKHNLPLCVHVREAHAQMIDLLKKLKSGSVIASEAKQSGENQIASSPAAPRNDSVQGVIHCYTGNWEYAQEYIKLGFYLGFTGVITFPAKKLDPKPQEALLEVVKKMPLDRMLLETDAPYLAPQKYRGQRSEPWMVEEIVKKIAELRGLSYEQVAKLTYENTLRLFDRIKIA